jgi:1,4-alpha-glucan branching enzyme
VRLIGALNRLYREEGALYEGDCRPEGFAWIDCNDAQHSVIVYERIEPKSGKRLVVALNFTPVVRNDYRIGLPGEGTYREIFNSDHEEYGGSGLCNRQDIHTHNHSCHERSFSTTITLPPLGAVILKQV